MPLYNRPPNMLLGMLPEWLRPDPAGDAMSMVTPLGMAGGFAGRAVPLFQRLGPRTQGVADDIFTAEEKAIQKGIAEAAEMMRHDPVFQRTLQLNLVRGNTNMAIGQGGMAKSALDAAIQQGYQTGGAMDTYGDLLDLVLMQTKRRMGR